MRSAFFTRFASDPEHCAGCAADRHEPTDDLHAAVAERVEVEVAAVVVADELHRRVPAGAVDVVDLVVALVELADPVEPPVDVATAVRARQPNVLADRDRDLAPGAAELVGDLHARRRRADDEHAAVARELRRPPVLQRRELLDASRAARPRARDARLARRAGRRPRRRRTRQLPVVGADVEAVGACGAPTRR